MKKLNAADLPGLNGQEIVDVISTGVSIFNATWPLLKEAFGKVEELFASIHTDALATPHGKRVAIEGLQNAVAILSAKDALQKELNKLYEAAFVKLGINMTDITPVKTA